MIPFPFEATILLLLNSAPAEGSKGCHSQHLLSSMLLLTWQLIIHRPNRHTPHANYELYFGSLGNYQWAPNTVIGDLGCMVKSTTSSSSFSPSHRAAECQTTDFIIYKVHFTSPRKLFRYTVSVCSVAVWTFLRSRITVTEQLH